MARNTHCKATVHLLMRLGDVLGRDMLDSIMWGKESNPGAPPERNSGVESFSNSAWSPDKYMGAMTVRIYTGTIGLPKALGALKTSWTTQWDYVSIPAGDLPTRVSKSLTTLKKTFSRLTNIEHVGEKTLSESTSKLSLKKSCE